MHESLKNPVSFIEHLSQFMNEKNDTKDSEEDYKEKISRILNDIDHNSGEVKRIFQDVDLHIHPADKRIALLIEFYSRLCEIPHKKDVALSNDGRAVMCIILMNHACPDLINPETGLLKDELIEVLGYKKEYDKKNRAQKMQITESIVDAYVFYFLSGIFTMTGSTLDLEKLQKELVTFDNLVSIQKFKDFIKNDAQFNFSRFTLAHKLILDSVDDHNHSFFKTSMNLTLITNLIVIYPYIRDQIEQCKGYYKMLGIDYGTAAEELLSQCDPKPDKKPSMQKQ